jgi:ferredoxin-NADP reductase
MSGEKVLLRVKNIVWETEDARTFELENISPEKIFYRAGQFLTFIFRFGEREVRRSYSLISAPRIDTNLQVTIKRMQNGELSRYLLDHLKTGDEIESLSPAGRFTIEPSTIKRTFFFFAAGSGITPVYSLIKYLLHAEPQSRIVLVYSNASESSTIFFRQLKELEKKFPSTLKNIFLFSRNGERINNSMLEKIVNENLQSDKKDAQFYFCGPSSYMLIITLTLVYMGFAELQLHRENFISEQIIQPETFASRNTAAHPVIIHFNNKKFDITIPPHKTILDAALDQKIPLPYSCKTGLCSTCSAICLNGKIEMTNNEVLTKKDLADGWILTCTGFPLEDNAEITFDKKNSGN